MYIEEHEQVIEMSLLRGGHSWQWQTGCYVYQRMALDLREPL